MKKQRHITAFYLETLLLVGLLVAVIMVLVGVFGIAKAKSMDATRLTDAVILAEDAAEALAASDSMEEVKALLDENGDAEMIDDVIDVLLIHRDGYDIRIWDPYGSDRAGISVITVSRGGETIYSLETWVYNGGEVSE